MGFVNGKETRSFTYNGRISLVIELCMVSDNFCKIETFFRI